ncbi:MAG: type II toxin-antitoxin system HicA family toxin [bacterium]|nr:type II toxin-antitoxin system HicA family toxin [bacterium]
MPRRVKVREAIRIVQREGWTLVDTRGSHRQFRHPVRPGKVTIPGSLAEVLHPKTWGTILKQAGISKEEW